MRSAIRDILFAQMARSLPSGVEILYENMQSPPVNVTAKWVQLALSFDQADAPYPAVRQPRLLYGQINGLAGVPHATGTEQLDLLLEHIDSNISAKRMSFLRTRHMTSERPFHRAPFYCAGFDIGFIAQIQSV